MPDVNCQDFELDLMELARGVPLDDETRGAVLTHVAGCPRCAAGLAAERAVTSALGDLAVRHRQAAASLDLETRLIETFTREMEPAHVRFTLRRFALAAGIVLVAGSGIVAWMLLGAPDASRVPRQDIALTSTDEVGEFVPWPLAPPLSSLERGDIVRVPVPPAMLPALGIAPVSVSRGDRLEAEVIVGQDGQPRAVRIIRSAGP
jgi:hypothetical protein